MQQLPNVYLIVYQLLYLRALLELVNADKPIGGITMTAGIKGNESDTSLPVVCHMNTVEPLSN